MNFFEKFVHGEILLFVILDFKAIDFNKGTDGDLIFPNCLFDFLVEELRVG